MGQPYWSSDSSWALLLWTRVSSGTLRKAILSRCGQPRPRGWRLDLRCATSAPCSYCALGPDYDQFHAHMSSGETCLHGDVCHLRASSGRIGVLCTLTVLSVGVWLPPGPARRRWTRPAPKPRIKNRRRPEPISAWSGAIGPHPPPRQQQWQRVSHAAGRVAASEALARACLSL